MLTKLLKMLGLIEEYSYICEFKQSTLFKDRNTFYVNGDDSGLYFPKEEHPEQRWVAYRFRKTKRGIWLLKKIEELYQTRKQRKLLKRYQRNQAEYETRIT